MIKFLTRAELNAYIATTPREGMYAVDADETMQNKKSVYQYSNGELILLSNEVKEFTRRTPVATYALLSGVTSPVGMDAIIVLADETHDGQPTQYYYDGYAWVYNGIYFKEELTIAVSDKNVRVTDITLDTNYTLPFKYVVGSGHLEIYLEEIALIRTIDFIEVGTLATVSDKIQFKSTIPKEARLIFRRNIASNLDETIVSRRGKVDVYYFDTFTDALNSPLLLDAGQVLFTFGHTTKNDGKGRYWILESTDKDFAYKNKANTLFLNRLIGASDVQVGAILPYVTGVVAPPESVAGEGQIANRADYKRIYNQAVANGWVVTEAEWTAGKKGYFSSGDGVNTFRFPDFTDRFVRVKGSLVAVGTAIADTYGSHTHTGSTASAGAHTHTISSRYMNITNPTYNSLYDGGGSNTGSINTSSSGAHTHTITINDAGSTETAPKHIAEPYYIKI
jgi:hypothetical protein